MTLPRHTPLALLLALTLLLTGGCATRSATYAWAEPDHGLLYRGPGQARSLTMDADPQRALADASPGTIDPWYLGRNDQAPSVVYGERATVYESTLTLTRDGQSISGDRVYDRFSQTTYRRRITRTRR
ncbi:MAG: hypothetical protein ACIAXF_16310 [Phycisphaerales bacterium JB063]